MASDFYAVVEPLDGTNTLTETIRVPEGGFIVIGGIRFLVHHHNCSGGTFSMTIKDASNNTIYTETITKAQLDSAEGSGNDYYGVWYNMTVAQVITLLPGNYTFNFTDDSGYSFTDDTNYIGWVKPHEDLRISTDYAISSIGKIPFGLEIWSYKYGN